MIKLSDIGRKEVNNSILSFIKNENITSTFLSITVEEIINDFENNKYVYEFSRQHTISGRPETISLDESMFSEVD